MDIQSRGSGAAGGSKTADNKVAESKKAEKKPRPARESRIGKRSERESSRATRKRASAGAVHRKIENARRCSGARPRCRSGIPTRDANRRRKCVSAYAPPLPRGNPSSVAYANALSPLRPEAGNKPGFNKESSRRVFPEDNSLLRNAERGQLLPRAARAGNSTLLENGSEDFLNAKIFELCSLAVCFSGESDGGRSIQQLMFTRGKCSACFTIKPTSVTLALYGVTRVYT